MMLYILILTQHKIHMWHSHIPIAGNPFIGVLKHKEKLYVFNSKEAALKFAHSPNYFISLVVEKAKRSPELIQLLKLHQTPSCVRWRL